ncbi:MAG: hypothetical protein JWO31_3052 [Phycisphaerales bacterium]|nr:hypothetical protein [Phycisphaerales bacterium]
MRFSWVGLIVLFSSSVALAQATGYVRELGFAGNYRPDCHVPLLVHLDSTTSAPAEYQLQVHQQDLDQDTVVYTRTVTLGPQAHENFWVYFQPQPTEGGLPGQGQAAQLGDVLKVHLYDKGGKTHVAALPVQAKAGNVDPGGSGVSGDRGVKVVLVVLEQGSFHAQEYAGAQGVMEDVLFVPVRTDALPDSAVGYEGLDAILWLDAKVSAIRNTPQFSALQQWVRQGGQLAVCQPSDRNQLDALADADMLPVVARVGPAADAAWAIQVRTKLDLAHLIGVVQEQAIGFKPDAWRAVEKAQPGGFEVAYAGARPDAMVDAWVDWPAEGDRPAGRSPLVARRAYGLGAVSWVAQDLGSGALNGAPDPTAPPPATRGAVANVGNAAAALPPRTLLTDGWPRLYDRVFGWRNQTRTAGEMERNAKTFGKAAGEVAENQYGGSRNGTDIGVAVVNRGTEHGARSTAYVFLAVVFFVGYWVVAGPGSYLFLAAKRRRGLSWTVFGATALAAALLTVVLVRLLLRGGAEAKHVTLVRLVPDAPAPDGTPRFAATMHGWVGLYIPKDGEQTVGLAAPSADRTASVGPYAIHPQWLKADKDAGFTDTAKYFVDTDPVLAGKAPSVGFPYRSTLKKIEGRWAGQTAEGVIGDVAVVEERSAGTPLAGKLTNKTGRDLVHVYLAYTYGWVDASASRNAAADRVLYLPLWKSGEVIDAAAKYAESKPLDQLKPGSGNTPIAGRLDPVYKETNNWSRYWLDGLGRSLGSDVYDDRDRGYPRSFPLMSLIDRVGPYRRAQAETDARPEPIRRGVRDFDASGLVASGRLVILAQSTGAPVPLPMDVNDNRLGGDGVTFYQIALPLNRDALRPADPTAAPATVPAATSPALRR